MMKEMEGIQMQMKFTVAIKSPSHPGFWGFLINANLGLYSTFKRYADQSQIKGPDLEG